MKARQYIPGLCIVLVIAVFSHYLSTFHASFDALVVSIIIGIFAGNLVGNRAVYEKGTEASIRSFLPMGIALYGSQLVVKGLHPGFVFAVFAVCAGLFGLTLWTARLFGVESRIAILLASGLAVCGATAIAVISPLIGAKREDTSTAIIAVVMLGLTGMIFYPLLYDMLSLKAAEFSFLAGTTLPMLGQVKVASSHIGPEVVSAAVEIKLIRMSFLVVLVAAAVLVPGRRGGRLAVPWFVILFILLVIAVNFTGLLLSLASYLRSSSSFFLSAGLAAIGFSVDFESIIERGMTPLTVIFLSWGTSLLLIYLARNVV